MPDIAIFIPSLRGGGAERTMMNIAAGMAARGLSVDLVVADQSGEFREMLDAAVRLIPLDKPRLLACIYPLSRYMRQQRPQVLLAAMTHANLVALAARLISRVECRVVVSVHNYFSIASSASPKVFDKVSPLLARFLYPFADKVIAVSNPVLNDLVSATGISPDATVCIPNPVDIDSVVRKSKCSIADDVSESEAGPLVLAVGRLVEDKGFDVLLYAFKQLLATTPASLIILGEGTKRQELEKMVVDLGIERAVRMPGFSANPYRYMARADVLVAPSRREGFCNVLVEAMACGTPVVATRCPGGPSEILADGLYGTLVEPENSESLYKGILQALERPVVAESLIERANIYALDAIVSQYISVLELNKPNER